MINEADLSVPGSGSLCHGTLWRWAGGGKPYLPAEDVTLSVAADVCG